MHIATESGQKWAVRLLDTLDINLTSLVMHDSLNISEHTHHVLLNKSLTISDTKQHTHTQLFILDS